MTYISLDFNVSLQKRIRHKYAKEFGERNLSHTNNLDHAFEIVLLIWSILFATFFQHMTWLWPREKWEGASSFVWAFFLIPLIVVIALWLRSQTSTDQNEKMTLRTVAWMFSLANMWSYSWIISVIIDVGITRGISELAAGLGLLAVIMFNILLVPNWLDRLFRRIMKLYKNESLELDFWKNQGKWTYRKAKRIGFALIGIVIGLIIIYVFTITIP